MESFTQFVETWASIYPNYIEFVILLFIGTALAFLSIFFYQYVVSEQSLENKVRNGKGIMFSTKNSILFLISFVLLISCSVLLSIVPSYIRWLLKLQPISAYFYPFLNFIILIIFYRLYFIPWFVKRQKNSIYINNSYILLKQLGNFILIPLTSINYVKFDKTNKIIRFRFSRMNLGGIFTKKAKFSIFFLNEDIFEKPLQIFMEKILFMVETQLIINRRLLASLMKNKPLLNILQNTKLISEAPVKIVTVIENIWGLDKELNIVPTIKEKKRLFLSFILFFLFYFIFTIWISAIDPGDYLIKIFSPNELSYLLIFPRIFIQSSNSFFSSYQIEQELNQIFFTIACFFIAYFLSMRIFKSNYQLPKLKNRQINKTHISLYLLSFLMFIYLFFTIEMGFYYLMYNSPYDFIYPSFGDTSGVLSYWSYQMLSLIIIAPVFEELVYRGVFLRYMQSKNYNIFLILMIEFLIFPFVHIPNLIDNPLSYLLENLFIKGLFSVISTLLMLKTKNIIYPILYHASWNIFVIIYPLYITRGNILTVESVLTGLIILISVIFLLLIILTLRRITSSFRNLSITNKNFWLIVQMTIFLLVLSQIFWVFTYHSSNIILNGLFFNLQLLYALFLIVIPIFVLYLFWKPSSSIYNMES